MKLSYWERTSFFENIDVAIIGSGIVGLNAAIHLKEQSPHLKVIILERGSLPSGASTRNAGFACFGSVTELVSDLKNIGLNHLLQLVEARWKGLQKLRQRVGDTSLGFLNDGGYELFLDQDHFDKHQEYIEFFNKEFTSIIGEQGVFQMVSERIAPFGFKNVRELVLNTAEGQIQTGEMMKSLLGIARDLGIHIYNGITVQGFHEEKDYIIIETKQSWRIEARQVIVATNGFTKKLFPQLTVTPARNQVLITTPIKNLPFKGTFHYDAGYYYFRNVGNRLLFGGARNQDLKTETTLEFGTTEFIQNTLVNMLEEVILPNVSFEVDQWWSGILGVGVSKEPIIKRLSDRMIVAVRLGGIGVAIGSLVGEEAARLVHL